MTGIAFAAALILSTGQAPTEQAPAPARVVRVFVHTDDLGDAPELAGRRDSVKDLREALAGSKKKTVAHPTLRGGIARGVVVEVVDRAVTIPKVVFGVAPATGPAGAGPARPAKAVHLRVKLA